MKPPIRSIRMLLEYNWADEHQDWMEHKGEAAHIFLHILKIDKWLQSMKKPKKGKTP